MSTDFDGFSQAERDSVPQEPSEHTIAEALGIPMASANLDATSEDMSHYFEVESKPRNTRESSVFQTSYQLVKRGSMGQMLAPPPKLGRECSSPAGSLNQVRSFVDDDRRFTSPKMSKQKTEGLLAKFHES